MCRSCPQKSWISPWTTWSPQTSSSWRSTPPPSGGTTSWSWLCWRSYRVYMVLRDFDTGHFDTRTLWHPPFWNPDIMTTRYSGTETFWHQDILPPRHYATQTLCHCIQIKTFWHLDILHQRHFVTQRFSRCLLCSYLPKAKCICTISFLAVLPWFHTNHLSRCTTTSAVTRTHSSTPP